MLTPTPTLTDSVTKRTIITGFGKEVKSMVDENLSRYLWKGLDLKRYSVVKIIPQDDTNAVIIMFSNDPNDPHWCLEYMGGGHYFDTAQQLMDYFHSRHFKKGSR